MENLLIYNLVLLDHFVVRLYQLDARLFAVTEKLFVNERKENLIKFEWISTIKLVERNGNQVLWSVALMANNAMRIQHTHNQIAMKY